MQSDAPAPFSEEAHALLALASLKGVGYWTLFKLKRGGISAQSILEMSDGAEVARTLMRHGAKISASGADWADASRRAVERAHRLIDETERKGIRIAFPDSPTYPRSLLNLEDPPAWLFIRGEASVLSAPSITAVGTRKPSPDGEWLSKFVGMNFADWKVPTVSGLATGMDQAVHDSSIRMGVPTIAVLGTGIQTEYPKGSDRLADMIVSEGGAIVTEYLPNDSYSGENFVRRNRLQAALGRVLIPIEWSPKSGTAHTVNYAATLGRPIAGLRIADWPDVRVTLPLKSHSNSRIFTVPREQSRFFEFVQKALAEPLRTRPIQPDLI
ncbi:DNA-protecting protein DprA [Ruegeria pomeroyi]|nr:DNA-protecting protein DprA [Ruegeria pomeroyi]